MMDNHIVNKFSRLFPSSFTSCQFRNIPDVVENSFIISKNSKFLHNNVLAGVSSRTNSSIKTQESKSNKNTFMKSSSSNSGWFSSEGENDETEDAFFSLSSGYFSESFRRKPDENCRKMYNQKSSEMGRCSSELSVNSVSRVGSNLDESKWVKSINGIDFASSKTEQNRGKTSNKTSPRSIRRTLRKTIPVEKFDYYSDFTRDTRRKTTKCRRKIKKSSSTSSDEMGKFKIVIDGRIEESIAVEKNTNDPYNDFRTSMLEMIVEKQIFGLKDLQRLLHCFLSLNSPSFHKIIFEVFSEICETLFH